MHKFVTVLFILIITAFISGCGGSDSTTAISATTISGVTKDAITDLEASGKILFSRSISGIVAYQLNADPGKTASWNSAPVTTDPMTSLDVTGTWIVSDGLLILTPAGGGTPVQITRIQKESTYWVAYDNANIISRFYLDLATAQAYNPAQIGGTVLGGPISAKFSNYSVSTYAGIARTAGFSNNSTATATQPTTATFNRPMGITMDSNNNFYIADFNNNVIRKIDQNGTVTTFAGNIFGIAGAQDGNGTAATFNHPSDITTDGTNLYVTDAGNNSIRIIEIANNQKVTTIGSTTGVAGSVDVKIESPATTVDVTLARFNLPTGITTDGTNLYVTDSGNNTIRKIVISTGAVSTLAGAAGAFGSADGIQTGARFNIPACITTDGSNLYVTDFNNSTIRKIVIATGAVSTLAGRAGTSGSTDAVGTAATFNQPNGITTDGTNLYVTDSFTNSIRKIVISSGAVTTIIAGTALTPGHADSPGAPSFDTPIGITTDGTSLFVADSLNNTIREIK